MHGIYVKCQIPCFYTQELLSWKIYCDENENVIKTCLACYIKYLLLVKLLRGFKLPFTS